MLPGMIFVLLKYAGKNEFNIPVYYEEGVGTLPSGCEPPYDKPYRLPEIMMRIADPFHETNLLIFPNKGLDFDKIQSDINGEFGIGTVWVKDAVVLFPDSAAYTRSKECIFLVNDPWQSVLFDNDRRIRGYYDLRLREEEDRLRVELKILQKRY